MKSNAVFSNCRTYRYALWRSWDESIPYAMFIGLNPSTADENENDPTINRCINFAKLWGYGGLCMVNLFALCTKDPSVMTSSKNPIGPENNYWINKLASDAGIVVAAWGNDGSHLDRSKEVVGMFSNLKCIKINKTGEPAHPLYQPATSIPIDI